MIASFRFVWGALAAIALTFAPGDAGAWQQETPFNATVNGHAFDRVVLRDDGCKIHVELYFSAPAAAYEGRAKERNLYRFVARIQLADGNTIRIGPFANELAGPRRKRHSHDTSTEACWAKSKPKVQGVDVHGCRGKGCPVKDFE